MLNFWYLNFRTKKVKMQFMIFARKFFYLHLDFCLLCNDNFFYCRSNGFVIDTEAILGVELMIKTQVWRIWRGISIWYRLLFSTEEMIISVSENHSKASRDTFTTFRERNEQRLLWNQTNLNFRAKSAILPFGHFWRESKFFWK